MDKEVEKTGIAEKALKLVLKAANKVDEKYYKEKSVLKYERIFCYEFYHQFRELQQEEEELNNNFILSGEPHKNIEVPIEEIYLKQEGKTGKKENVDNIVRCSPDFIFHHGIDDYNPSNQILAIEVKVNYNTDNIAKDIRKLKELTNCKKLNFQKGIFMAIGKKVSEFKEMMHDVHAEHNDIFESSDKVYLIAIDDNIKQYCCYEISSLLKDNHTMI